MTKILVYRFSAMGDVVLLLPVLKGVLAANRDVEMYFVTPSNFFPIFQNIERLNLIDADLRGKHKGFFGLIQLFRKIRTEVNPDLVFDLHSVLRTFNLDILFRITGCRVIIFRKGTFRKMLMIKSKLLKRLPNAVTRYSDAFVRAGFQINLPEPPLFPQRSTSAGFPDFMHKSIVIGIAPFAKHEQKIWGTSKIENLIVEISKVYDASILLFGGGKVELEILNQLSQKYPNCIVSANHFSFSDEIQVFSKLNVMISMDSANMHLASMAGVPTISIWGATHPALGFAPYKQPAENIIQYEGDKLSCRPCSVYGNKKCIYSDSIRCMEYIQVNTVFERIRRILSVN
ncbi:MAG: glycosyltransferase family 9 protein [Prolixibacteraceae bacterium]|jgi:ADP-heptose:LPS heptosyltransferase